MRIAVVADVHANWAAFDAVRGALAAHAPDGVLCLGDIVGYNAAPRPCIDAMRQIDWVIAGNHDLDVGTRAMREDTNKNARAAQQWTADVLDERQLTYLRQLPRRVVHDEFVAVHACYRNDDHTYGYVTSTMLGQNLERIAHHPEWPQLAFCGHSHQPLMGWRDRAGGVVEGKLHGVVRWPLRATAVLVNPGSVGQPRDGDPRAAYAIVDIDKRRVAVHRVAYDVEHTAAEVLAAGLPAVTAERLREGR